MKKVLCVFLVSIICTFLCSCSSDTEQLISSPIHILEETELNFSNSEQIEITVVFDFTFQAKYVSRSYARIPHLLLDKNGEKINSFLIGYSFVSINTPGSGVDLKVPQIFYTGDSIRIEATYYKENEPKKFQLIDPDHSENGEIKVVYECDFKNS